MKKYQQLHRWLKVLEGIDWSLRKRSDAAKVFESWEENIRVATQTLAGRIKGLLLRPTTNQATASVMNGTDNDAGTSSDRGTSSLSVPPIGCRPPHKP